MKKLPDLYKILTKDYFSDLDIWKQYLEFLFEVNNLNEEKGEDNGFIQGIIETKEGLNKSMQVLSKKSVGYYVLVWAIII